ncbi:MAG: hypothetical protein ACYDHT_02600 [Solirubrobacteraceae bacterium]
MSVVLAVAAVFAAVGATSAMAGIDHELSIFAQCPTETAGVEACAYSTVTGGEFKFGSKTTPIVNPVTLQGGILTGSNELQPAKNGETLSKTPEPAGSLTGIGLPGEEITAISELAGPVFLNSTGLLRGGPAVQLPLKVKLENAALGSSCYIGSNSEPISLVLTTGETSPPPPNTPISGKTGTLEFRAAGNIIHVAGTTVVDNSFAVPGANGCGPGGSEDSLVDSDAGLPSAAGNNKTVQETEFSQAYSEKIKHQFALPAIGRCVKAAKGTGEYEDAKCVGGAGGEGKFNWIEGPGANPKFTSTGTVAKLEGVGGKSILCKKSTGSGEYTGAKTLTESITFTGCALPSKATCQSAGSAAGEITTSQLSGKLGFIEDKSGPSDELLVSVGLDLSNGSALVAAECGGASEPLTVTGSVIGAMGKLNAMTGTLKFTATQSGGKQSPEAFEEEAKDTLSATLGSGPEQAGLAGKLTIHNQEKLELKGSQQ